MNKNQWVVPADEGWAVRGEGDSRASSIHRTQREAIEVARQQAKALHSEMVVQGRDGKIRERNSYGNDPYPPRG